jgi:hypothetical protein
MFIDGEALGLADAGLCFLTFCLFSESNANSLGTCVSANLTECLSLSKADERIISGLGGYYVL